MPRPLAALLCLLLPLAVLAFDEPVGRDIPYQKLYEPLAAVHQADPDGVVVSILRAESAQPGQPLPTDLKIELRAGAAPQPINPAADGRFTLPLRADWASSGATLWINQPRSAVVISESFTMRTPTSTHPNYGQLMESLPVVERLQKQPVAIMGLMTSRPKGVELAYESGAAQTVTVGTGAQAKSWSTDDQGRVKVPFDPALPATTPVELSAPPAALRPYGE